MAKKDLSRANRILPEHIGIIMDGNGRWAKKRGLPRPAGHRAGAKNFRTITRYCNSIGIKYLTVYAFSTENWRRPVEEVNALMKLFREYLEEALRDFREENIRTRFIGDVTAFSPDLQALIKETEELSSDKTGLTLNIAMNYGGRTELCRAVNQLIASGKNEVKEQDISNALYTATQPDPDLIIRPSGEYRSSNFLLWQSAYSEYVFMNDILWPDFTTEDLEKAIDEYCGRNRRYGGL
ncbi:MAG: di-trans,poly-cis-decaprenylcistransferase [Oscillospiraceae bacterium]|jgi:undecaprenyl diphosphate synthase|nr:di-trans,poly-cis-decaprenylcistransferase [Oscillospiraceae bacterium]